MLRQIRTSAKAVVIREGKLLAIKVNDRNQIGIDWLDISELNKLPLYPSKLRRAIMNFCEGKEYQKYLGNEEIGDPVEISSSAPRISTPKLYNGHMQRGVSYDKSCSF